MSLLSSVGLTLAFKSEDPGFESAHQHLFQILSSYLVRGQLHSQVSTAIHSVMNTIGQDRFIVGENSGYANINQWAQWALFSSKDKQIWPINEKFI
jgi:hypothetical protein